MVCYCEGHCPGDIANGTCIGQPGSQCFSAVEEVYNSETDTYEPERTYGCLPPDERGFMQVYFNDILLLLFSFVKPFIYIINNKHFVASTRGCDEIAVG